MIIKILKLSYGNGIVNKCLSRISTHQDYISVRCEECCVFGVSWELLGLLRLALWSQVIPNIWSYFT